MLPNLYLAEFSWIFERPGLDLGNKRQRRQAIFAGFQKVISRVVIGKFSGSLKTKYIKSNVHFLPLENHLMLGS